MNSKSVYLIKLDSAGNVTTVPATKCPNPANGDLNLDLSPC